MGFNLGDIFVTFKAKTEDLQAGVAKTQQLVGQAEKTVNNTSFKAFSAQASTAFGGVATAIQGVITKAAIFATTSSVGLGTFIKSAADLQQTSKSFEVLTGNVEVANGLFAKLAEYANNTPFEFPDIAKAGQILLGFGIKSEDVYKRITMLGDIAAATGADFTSLSLVFGQVNATGRLMGQDALQLINNKIPITSILAKKLGLNVQEVKAKMEEGSISADMFNEALEGVTQAGGFAFNGTAILAQSLNGRMSTLKDTVLEFGRNLLGVKVDPQLGLVIKPGGLFDRFSNLVPKIGASLQELGPKIAAGFDWLVTHGELIKSILGGVAAAFVAAKVAAVGFAIAAAANPVTLIATAIVVLIGVLTALQMRFDWIGQAIAFLKPFIDGLAATFDTYLKPILMTVAGIFTGQLLPALMQVWDAVKRLWDALNPALVEAVKMVAMVFGGLLLAQIMLVIGIIGGAIQVLSWLVSAISNVVGWLANLANWFGIIAVSAAGNVRSILGWFGQLPGAIGGIVNAVIGWFKDMPGKIGGAVKGIGDVIQSPFKAAFNAIAKMWNNSVGKLSFKAPSWVPGIGGKGWDMPNLPYLAKGVENFAGGWAVVGERGPELTYLPKGTSVYSNDKSRDMTGRTVTIHGDVNIDSKQDADYFFAKFDRNIQLETMGGSV